MAKMKLKFQETLEELEQYKWTVHDSKKKLMSDFEWISFENEQ